MREDVILVIALIVVAGVAAYVVLSGISSLVSSGGNSASQVITAMMQGAKNVMPNAPPGTTLLGVGLAGLGLLTFPIGGIVPLALGGGILGYNWISGGSSSPTDPGDYTGGAYGGGSGGPGGATGSW